MRVYTSPVCELHVNRNAGVEAPDRYPAMLAGVEAAERAGVEIERHFPSPASGDALLAVHDARYLDLLREISASGGGGLDADTAMNSRSWEAALAASGAAIGAVEGAMRDGVPSFAVVRPPGHHAGRDYAMGFCLVNHAAVAAARARSLGARRVAVLDWDVHHGNGTQDIFYRSNDVLYLSVHRGRFYPGTGRIGEVGEGAGEGMTLNAPLRAGSVEEDYAAVFAGVFLPVLREFGPEALIVSVGYDAHAADPLGGMRLEAGSFGRFAASLSAVAREVGSAPVVFIMEGGYDLAAISDSVAATIEGAERGEAPAWEGTEAIQDLRRALAPHWKSLRD